MKSPYVSLSKNVTVRKEHFGEILFSQHHCGNNGLMCPFVSTKE